MAWQSKMHILLSPLRGRRFLLLTAALTVAFFLIGCKPSVDSTQVAVCKPALRMLNHWDNPDGTIERGYAGRSIFWGRGYIDTLTIQQYGLRNEAIGINGTVLNNVNASPRMLTEAYLDTTAIYANLLRPYGIKVFLSVNFASPMALKATATADPLDDDVQQWWKDKADEIYRRIPDFGGFLVKANSEGQPGPCDYHRTHAEGANMLAKALTPHNGIVIWRSFVYSQSDPDRAKQAYIEFAKLDGQFDDNVIVQIKNGPIDFQPREPISPLFFAMPHTRLMAELQITQEYLGHSNHIAFLAPMWTEFLQEYWAGSHGMPHNLAGLAGVSNIGTLGCGNTLAEANWFAFGRLASDPSLTADAIAEEWVNGEFPKLNEKGKNALIRLLLMSREAVVDYMMPLGLHHLFAWGHHYGPEPWCNIPGARPDWMPSYYHKADTIGLGFDRTATTGSAATMQYPDSMAKEYECLDSCPEKYILWFHHVKWNYQRRWECCDTTETLWQHLGRHYEHGVQQVTEMQRQWQLLKGQLPDGLWQDINRRLETQYKDAIWWRDSCLLYFQSINGLSWPSTAAKPIYTLQQLKKINLGITNYECPSPALLDAAR